MTGIRHNPLPVAEGQFVAFVICKYITLTHHPARLPVCTEHGIPDSKIAHCCPAGRRRNWRVKSKRFRIFFCNEQKELTNQLPLAFGVVCAEYGCNKVDRKGTRLNSSHVAISYAVFGSTK